MRSSYSTQYSDALLSHFSYLTKKFGYSYNHDGNYFSKGDIRVYVNFEPHTVSVEYWLVTEPEFTKLPISWFLGMMQKEKQPNIEDKISVEQTISAYAIFFEDKIDEISKMLPEILLPALKLLLSTSLAITKLSKEDLLKADDFRKINEYIKIKDPSWNF